MVDITPSEVIKEYETKEKEFGSRFQRMDRDFKLWDETLVKHEEAETAINVTSNTPRTFADSVGTRLNASNRQITIRMAEEGEDRRDDISKQERMLEFALNKADERLVRLLLPPMKEYVVWTSMVRGWQAARILNYKLGKDIIFDYTPFDPRWLVYEVGSKGFIWTGYKTFRSRADLKATYKYDAPSSPWWNPFSKDKESVPVIERWDVEGDKIFNTLVCGDKFLKEPTQAKLSSIPVLIMPVTNRPPIVGNLGTEFERFGDSIYAPNRTIYELKDKFASMWFTHANLLAKQPLFNYYTPGQGKTDLGETTLHPEMMLDIPKGYNEIVPSPLKEISPTLVEAMRLIRMWEEQGSLPALELTQPPPSGTALAIIEEARSKVYGPQLRLLDRFYTAICYLIEEQLIYGKLKVDVKTEKEHKYWGYEITPVDLKRPHTIKVEHISTTPWTQMDSYQIADMAKRLGLPDEFIFEHILKLQDPKGLTDQAAIEVAEHSPEFMMLKAVRTLLKKGRGDEAKRLMVMMSQRAMAEETGLRAEAEGVSPGGQPPGEIPLGGGI